MAWLASFSVHLIVLISATTARLGVQKTDSLFTLLMFCHDSLKLSADPGWILWPWQFAKKSKSKFPEKLGNKTPAAKFFWSNKFEPPKTSGKTKFLLLPAKKNPGRMGRGQKIHFYVSLYFRNLREVKAANQQCVSKNAWFWISTRRWKCYGRM